MIGKLLPIIMLLIGVAAGGGTGLFLRPAPEEAHVEGAAPDAHGEAAQTEGHAAEDGAHAEGEGGEATHEYVKMNNQFVVPVVNSDTVESLVVMSLSVEVKAGDNEKVFAIEPKLRDAFLQVMFDHANMGGFRGTFTSSNNMKILRRALLEQARKTTGDLVSDVLITDIARQDV